MRRTLPALVAAFLAVTIVPAVAIAHWPVDNRSSYISQGYSARHQAYDLASYSGTPITPVRSGKVVFAGWKSDCGGRQVYVSHGNGLYTAYYHLRSIAVWKGEWVTDQLTRLGRVGESGCATGPHLHIEVWHGYPWHSGSYRVSPWTYIDSGTWLPYRYR
jgi:murein DD-endopeptidase MepM/ murein hydrolase activator NlpD